MSRIMTSVQFAKKYIGSKAMSDGEAMSVVTLTKHEDVLLSHLLSLYFCKHLSKN